MGNHNENTTDSKFLYNLIETTNKDDLNYIYRGEFSNDISHFILSLAEKNIGRSGIKSRTKKRVFHIMVESIQNITRHQDAPETHPELRAIFTIQKNEGIYFVTTGNIIENDKIEDLQQKLNKVNSLDKEALTKFYREILSDGKISEKGGAGLGLIEIARKAGNKLFYDFNKINDEFSFFYMHTYINTSLDANNELPANNIFSFDYIKKIHSIINKQNILLIYSSIFDQSSLLSLISILGGQMKGKLVFKKKVISTMVELLQNIIHHGYPIETKEKGHQGVFFISRDKTFFALNTINYISNKSIASLDEKLSYINSLNEEGVENYYNETLFDFAATTKKGGGGLGFIEMKQKSKNNIDYKFTKVNEEYSFFYLKITFQTS